MKFTDLVEEKHRWMDAYVLQHDFNVSSGLLSLQTALSEHQVLDTFLPPLIP